MESKLTKTPLTYVIMIVKISSIMDLESYIPKLQELIRQDFPISNSVNIHTIDVKPNRELEFKQIKQWHFADKFSTTGILIDANNVMLHATHYDSFGSLSEKFIKVLNNFNKTLKVSLCMRIGLRYINLIHGEPEKYLNKELLGFKMPEKKYFKKNYISNVETYQESESGVMKIKSTLLAVPCQRIAVI